MSYLLAPAAAPPRYGLDHEFAVDSPEFVDTMAGASGSPFLPGNRLELLNNGDAFYPPMLEAIEGAERSITIEAYIYWAGDIGQDFADALAEQAQAGRPVKILLDAIGSASIGAEILDVARSRRLPGRLVQPDPLVHARPLQQPHAPQVADRRRPDRLHRRRRHRRSLARQRPRSRRVARYAGPHRRPGGRAAADRVRAQLAADDRRTAVR